MECQSVSGRRLPDVRGREDETGACGRSRRGQGVLAHPRIRTVEPLNFLENGDLVHFQTVVPDGSDNGSNRHENPANQGRATVQRFE